VRIARYWNNRNQVHSKSKDLKAN